MIILSFVPVFSALATLDENSGQTEMPNKGGPKIDCTKGWEYC